MGKVILCNGNYATTPYCLQTDEVRFFSIEEICYYIYKTAFFLQDDFFSDSLIQWIKEELGLVSWADTLLQYRGKEDGLLHSIEFLFAETGYYGETEMEKIKSVLCEGSRLTVEERKKMRADLYCKKQKYAMALAEYGELLQSPASEDERFKAKLYHNMGVCHAGMFAYGRSAESFKKAFDIYPNTESYVQFLTALKLGSTQEEYLSYLADNPQSYDDSLEVENRISSVLHDWTDGLYEDVIEKVAEEENITVYAALKHVVKQKKEEYISMVNKG